MDSQIAGITVNRLAGALGAEIAGVNLAEPGYDNSFPNIHQAFLDHAVLVVRKQNLSPDQLVAFSKKFGTLESHVLEAFNLDENPEVSELNRHISLVYKTNKELIKLLNEKTKI